MKFPHPTRRPLTLATYQTTRSIRTSAQPYQARAISSNPILNDQFLALGLSPPIVQALHTAFPHIVDPSPCQNGLIPAILKPNSVGVYPDILLRAGTGTGKSFGLTLALLSKQRLLHAPPGGKRQPPRRLTNLILVPQRELAYQYQHWIEKLFPSEHQQLVQMCVRGDPAHPIPMHLLRDTPASSLRSSSQIHPPVLIATPQALFELLQSVPPRHRDDSSPSSLPIGGLTVNLGSVVVDEVDSMLALPPRDATPKQLQAWGRHIPPVIQLLDAIYGTRYGGQGMAASSGFRPQLVLASATLNVHQRNYVFSKTAWLRPPPESEDVPKSVLRLEYTSPTSTVPSGPETTSEGPIVEHSCAIVSEDGEARNIEIPLRDEEPEIESYGLLSAGEKRRLKADHKERTIVNKAKAVVTKPSPSLIQTISTLFALDVPSLALLVIPSTYNVHQTVEEFKALGVEAQAVDLSRQSDGRMNLAGSASTKPELSVEDSEDGSASPRLLISTLATTRGLDFPSLTHVFISGASIVKNPSDYRHVAGRVGRFSKKGKVITVVEAPAWQGMADGAGEGPEPEEKRMRRLYEKVGVVPARIKWLDLEAEAEEE